MHPHSGEKTGAPVRFLDSPSSLGLRRARGRCSSRPLPASARSEDGGASLASAQQQREMGDEQETTGDLKKGINVILHSRLL